MRIWHGAALAFTGTWLLLMPPQEKRPLGQVRAMTETPLSQWSTIGTFPTQNDCEAAFNPRPLKK